MEKETSEHPPHPGHAFCWFWKYSDPFFHDKNFSKILVCFVFCRCLLKIRSRTPVRSHFHRAQSHPHPPLQHSCSWLHGEAISPITRTLVLQGTEIKASILQSVSRWAATRFLSHWEVCNNLTGLKWKNIQGSFTGIWIRSTFSRSLWRKDYTDKCRWSQSLYFYTLLAKKPLRTVLTVLRNGGGSAQWCARAT